MSLDLTTAVITLLALLAFASNSLLTRLALGAHQIDAATFTLIRLLAGAGVLAALVGLRARSGFGGGCGGDGGGHGTTIPESYAVKDQ